VLERGRQSFGFVPVLVGDSGKLPFPDGYFDIVYCSSVIEHVTIPKDQVWDAALGQGVSASCRASTSASSRARSSASDGSSSCRPVPVVRAGEPQLDALRRVPAAPAAAAAAQVRRGFWPKSTNPDWCLLDRRELRSMFEGAEIRDEKWLGLTKSIMAVKTERPLHIMASPNGDC
jgi:2-polyprenyl-3-methyl-5-hydroxy-6-metoxy-1,4-benzoquinol methylase